MINEATINARCDTFLIASFRGKTCGKTERDCSVDNVNGGITVLNIEDTPSYYNPEKKEFTLNYRYNYNSNDWYEMKEVMSPVAIANENN